MQRRVVSTALVLSLAACGGEREIVGPSSPLVTGERDDEPGATRASRERATRDDEGVAATTAEEPTAPDVAAPDVAALDVAALDVAALDVAAPDVAAPDVAAPDVAAPDVAAPDVAAPDVTSPDVTSPVVAAPVVAAPEVTAPAPTRPGLALRAIRAERGEDGRGATVAATSPVAIDLDARRFPPRALDPVLTIGSLRLAHYQHPRPGVLRFVLADRALLAPGAVAAVQYGDDATSRIIVSPAIDPSQILEVAP